MPNHSIPTEFDLELRSERGRWLRRRLLWLCAIGILATILLDGQSIHHDLSYHNAEHHYAAQIQIAEAALCILIYAAAFAFIWRGSLRQGTMLRLAFAIVVAVVSVELISQRIVANAAPDPDQVLSPATVYAIVAAMILFIEHFFACLFIPWTLRESLGPAAFMLGTYAIIVSVDIMRRKMPTAGLWSIPVLAVSFAPGTAICWWRSSRFHKSFLLRFESARYRVLQSELASARRLHESALPAQKDDGPIRLQYAYEPMRQIGGDLLYIHSPPDDPMVLSAVVLDVTGHGIAAALTVNRLIGELERLFGEAPDAQPDHILRGLNRYVALTLARHTIFATAFCVRLDTKSGSLHWANGGHPPAFVRRADGRIEPLDSTAPLLGAVNGDDFFNDVAQTSLALGDVLLVYTDGLSEASNPHGVQLGTEGVRRLIANVAGDGQTIPNWPRAMLNGALNYRHSPAEDDTLVVAIYRKDGA
ncbi:MAG TPA: PP2C family protein-serine/threonine phosphatase [Humisphaera sp.]|jgi:hypothetical protein|nr:PP2C family protein-serine/threonine phosphatase [Humisphaera sp.]